MPAERYLEACGPAGRPDGAGAAGRHPRRRAERGQPRRRGRDRRRRDPVPALRPGADEPDRDRALQPAAGPRQLRGPGTPGPGGHPRPHPRRRAGRLAARPRQGPGRHGGGRQGQVRRAAASRPPRLVPRARLAAWRLGLPPVPVLLPDERLALDVRRRQRPRGGLGAGVRHPRGAARRLDAADLVRGRRARRARRGPPPPLGRPEAPEGRRPRHRVPGRRLARDLHGARRVHHAAAAPRRAAPPRRARRRPADLARHAQPAGPGRPRRGPQAPRVGAVRRLRARRRADRRARAGGRVVPDRHLGRHAVGRRVSRPVGPRHRRSARRRAGAGRPEVHPDGYGPPVLERPARVRRARQRGDAGRDPRGARRPDRDPRGRARRGDRGGGRPLGGAARAWASRSGRSASTRASRPIASGAPHEVEENEARLASLRSSSAELKAAIAAAARLPRRATTPGSAATRARTSRTPRCRSCRTRRTGACSPRRGRR